MADPTFGPDAPGTFATRRLSVAETVARADRLAQIYRAALGEDAEPTARWAANLRTCVPDYEGATVLAALADQEVLGFLYGFDLQLQHWWPQQIRGALESRGLGEWLEDCFELVDLEVDPGCQGRGIGTALLTRQLAEMPHRRMLLSTDPVGRARGLYHRLGARDLVPDFVYEATTHRAALMGWDRGA